jgi:ribokinase
VPPRILVVGSANVDFTVAVDRLPAPGETVSGGTLLVVHGGKGANQAVAASRLGAEVRFVGCVGRDPSGADVRSALARDRVDTTGLVDCDEAATGTALIVVDDRGRNQIAVAPGANWRLMPSAIAAREADFAWAEVLLCQLETPMDTVLAALRSARRHGVLTMLNPAPVRALDSAVWPLVDCLTPNEGEAERLTGATIADAEGPARAARELVARGAGTVVVTLGERGAVARGRLGDVDVPALQVEAVDTTGAGDAFNGALAVAIARRLDFRTALEFASVAAGLTCTRRGARPSLPTLAAVTERLPTTP